MAESGYQVIEAPQMNARAHRGVGKSDSLDARRIAEAALPLEEHQLRHPRSGEGERAALRVLVTARDHMTGERTATVNALMRAIDLGIDARCPLPSKQTLEISRRRAREEPLAQATARAEVTRLAGRVVALDGELAVNQKSIATLVGATPAHGLLEKTGIARRGLVALGILTATSRGQH
ncbi:IS110 family transposase [Nocardia takedensis]